MDNFIEEQRAVTIKANQETDTVESSLDKKLDGFQRKLELVHQEEGNLEDECLTDTNLGKQAQLQP